MTRIDIQHICEKIIAGNAAFLWDEAVPASCASRGAHE